MTVGVRHSVGLYLMVLLMVPVVAFSEERSERPVVSVMNFATSGISDSDAVVVVDYLSSIVVNMGTFRVIDRTQREAVLREIEFSYSNSTDENRQIEMGKLLAATYIITGSIGKLEDRFLVNVKLIDVQSGETLKTYSGKYDALSELIDDSEHQMAGFLVQTQAPERVGAQVTQEPPAKKQTEVVSADSQVEGRMGRNPETTASEKKARLRYGSSVEFAAGYQRSIIHRDPYTGEDLQPFNVAELYCAGNVQLSNSFGIGGWIGLWLPIDLGGIVLPPLGMKLLFGNVTGDFAVGIGIGLPLMIEVLLGHFVLNINLLVLNPEQVALGASLGINLGAKPK